MKYEICNQIAEMAPIGLIHTNYSRYGSISSIKMTWVRYSPQLNGKRGRFGLRKRVQKICTIKFETDSNW